MATRKIIDPKQNGEKVWLKGHAKAIYMSDGRTVEDAINAGGGGGGGILVETDPVFSASPAATITEEDKVAWSGKQGAISDLETIREGALKGTTALQYYVTAFDFGDLNSERDLFQEEVDKANLVAAIRANKLILMPHDKTIPEIGFFVLACYVEDFLYIDCTFGSQVFHVETDINNSDIYASERSISTFATQDDVGDAITEAITNVINASY